MDLLGVLISTTLLESLSRTAHGHVMQGTWVHVCSAVKTVVSGTRFCLLCSMCVCERDICTILCIKFHSIDPGKPIIGLTSIYPALILMLCRYHLPTLTPSSSLNQDFNLFKWFKLEVSAGQFSSEILKSPHSFWNLEIYLPMLREIYLLK